MYTFIVVIHVLVSFVLIGSVLLQPSKNADMGASFGGSSSQSVFGATGAPTVMAKVTKISAVIFMITSLSLAYLSSSDNSVLSAVQQTQSVPAKDSQAK